MSIVNPVLFVSLSFYACCVKWLVVLCWWSVFRIRVWKVVCVCSTSWWYCTSSLFHLFSDLLLQLFLNFFEC
jgi:hypothetical protein